MLTNKQRTQKIKQIALTIMAAFFLTGCNFISNTFTYRDTTKEFAASLIKEDYDKCVALMAMEKEIAKSTNIDSLKIGLATLRQNIVNTWGIPTDYTFVKSEKTFSTVEAENTPPNTTIVYVEFNNDKNLGMFQVFFDDDSKKILYIKALDIIAPVPNMTTFWLFGLLAICIPIFNIYVIRKIKKSSLNKKWLKYIAVIFLNVPAITYTAINGLSFHLLNFQILFGISFGWGGFLNSFWTFGIPFGGLYWFWKLRQKKQQEIEMLITTEENLPAIES